MKSHDWFVEHRVDYATGTLDPEDATAFAAHLAHCEECRREVSRVEAELAWLPMALDPVPPRPGFQRQIIQRVLEGNGFRRRTWMTAAALAASLLLAVAGWYTGDQRARKAETQLAGQQARLAAVEDTLSIMRRAGRVLQANVQVGQQRGGLVIIADEVTHRWNVVVHGLPPAPAGERYQFWFISAEGMVRGAELEVEPARPMIFTTDMPKTGGEVMGAALTLEPVGLAEGPPRGKQLVHLML
jgi:anti-sigma-K factor RskA